PEQAQGKTGELGPGVDIYSLGAILYELLTGRPPFREETPLDTVMRVINHMPEPPHLINADIDHDLETICLKCLEKDPAMRYKSAEELGDDLQRYLDGDSIHARSFNMLDRLAHVLERDQHTADFATWSSMLFLTAIAVGLEHFTVFALVMLGQPNVLVVVARGFLFLFLGGLFYYNRGNKLLPTSPAERELWTIWIGYFTSYFIIVIVTRLLIHCDVLQPTDDWAAREYLKELLPYPFIAMMSGLAFFIMGANYWGRCYAFGLAFFVVAALMPLKMTFAPLAFGIVWLLTLGMLATHLRKQAHASQSTSMNSSPSQAPTVQYKGPR
ncbi:MAG TPA: hypothetical protein VFE62_23665, partial [Gemmataceae bacterium]|nr:hypothetical protein [Gemmataceae bacterium]